MSRGKSKAIGAQNVKPDAITPDELKAIRAYRAEVARRWWAKQSPEERRQRRQRYDLNHAKRLLKQIEHDESEEI